MKSPISKVKMQVFLIIEYDSKYPSGAVSDSIDCNL